MNTEQKIDKILENLTEMKIILARHSLLHEKNTEDLDEHMRRTKQNEELIAALRLDFKNEIDPVKKHVNIVEAVAKNTLYVLGIISAIVLALHELGILKKLF